MVRNPLDVLTSRHGNDPDAFYVSPQRLAASLALYAHFVDEAQVTTIRYEDLVSQPNTVQQHIGSRLGLTSIRPFTDAFPHFSGHSDSVVAMHSVRPIDTHSVDRWRDNEAYAAHLRQVLDAHPVLIEAGRALGYPMTLE